MRHDVHARAMAHGRRMQHRVARDGVIDFAQIGMATQSSTRCVIIAPFGRPVVPDV